jgi:hypothetical protein
MTTTLGPEWGKSPIESVGALPDDGGMELLTNIGAILTGLVTLMVGAFSVATILFDDLM